MLSQDGSRRDSGAAVVEMAVIFGILAMLLVGTVTAAIAFGRNNSIENAAREASRYAATLNAPSGVNVAWLQEVRDVARNAAMGNLDSSVPGQYICVAHFNGAGWVGLTDTGGTQSSISSSCFPDNLTGDSATQPRVQIETSRETTINAALFSTDVTLTGQAAARYER